MTHPEGIIATPVDQMDQLMEARAIAATRNQELDLMPYQGQTWVIAAKEELTDEIIGVAAVHIPSSIFDSSPAELLFDVVKPEKQGQGIGNLLVQRTVELVQVITGRDTKVPKEVVESNKDDFEDRKIREANLGSYVVFAA
jgi:hypothetical protein